MKIKNLLNADKFPAPKNKIDGLHETIPDQSLSMRQILDRYARNLSVFGKIPIFDEDEDPLPDFRTLDLSEIEDIKNQTKQLIEDNQQKFTKKQQQQQKQKLLDELKLELEKQNKAAIDEPKSAAK